MSDNKQPWRCEVCEKESYFTWTLTHGIATCQCGIPYRLYHYDENNEFVDKPPENVMHEKYGPHVKDMREYIGKHGNLEGYKLPKETK